MILSNRDKDKSNNLSNRELASILGVRIYASSDEKRH